MHSLKKHPNHSTNTHTRTGAHKDYGASQGGQEWTAQEPENII